MTTIVFVTIVAGCFATIPYYNVWQQEISRKVESVKTEQNRKIGTEEAKTNLETGKLNAQAEIGRARGAAEVIKIEDGSTTPAYIQYLWTRQQNNLNDKTVICTLTETNLPVSEAARNE